MLFDCVKHLFGVDMGFLGLHIGSMGHVRPRSGTLRPSSAPKKKNSQISPRFQFDLLGISKEQSNLYSTSVSDFLGSHNLSRLGLGVSQLRQALLGPELPSSV